MDDPVDLVLVAHGADGVEVGQVRLLDRDTGLRPAASRHPHFFVGSAMLCIPLLAY